MQLRVIMVAVVLVIVIATVMTIGLMREPIIARRKAIDSMPCIAGLILHSLTQAASSIRSQESDARLRSESTQRQLLLLHLQQQIVLPLLPRWKCAYTCRKACSAPATVARSILK